MRKWEKHFREFKSQRRELVEEVSGRKPDLRFECAFVRASDVAQQYFCEKKVEMQYIYGRVETEAKSLGIEAHENLLADTTEIEAAKLWQEIYGKAPVTVHEMPLMAKFKNIILVGVPDSVLYVNGFPTVLFEYKFSKRGTIFDSYQVQAQTYGFLLRNAGFDVSRLFLAVVVADPRAKDDKDLKNRVITEIFKNGPKESFLTVSRANIFISKFNCAKAEEDLDWALDFWKQQREAIPTTNPRKCISCEFNEKCIQEH
jgi:CRISPR/Cas system-associated exonuclease Cas4 (RecB family)